MMAEPIQIKMSNHEIAMARIHVSYVEPLKKKSAWIILGLFMILSFVANFTLGGRFESVAEMLIGLVAIAGSWFLFNYTRERGNKEAARMYVEGFTLTLREEGVLYQVGEAFEILPWSKFGKSLRTRKWFYLYFTSNWALIIPRSSFSTEEKFLAWMKVAENRILPSQMIDQKR